MRRGLKGRQQILKTNTKAVPSGQPTPNVCAFEGPWFRSPRVLHKTFGSKADKTHTGQATPDWWSRFRDETTFLAVREGHDLNPKTGR
jgi:hypothetical protein